MFAPSKRNISKSLIELPILINKLDEQEDVLVIHTYLVEAEVPFLCGRQTLEKWYFNINEKENILELKSKLDRSKIQMKMVDTHGGHYAIVLKTRQVPDSKILFVEDESQDVPILLLDDKQGNLCSFKAVRKVHKINSHKGKDQLITAYRNTG